LCGGDGNGVKDLTVNFELDATREREADVFFLGLRERVVGGTSSSNP
jgi:hypothetical protein